MPTNLENLAVATVLEKISFDSNPKERQCQRRFKLPHNSTHFTNLEGSVQNPSRLQQYVNRELSHAQAGFRKSRGTRDQIASLCWIIEKGSE